MDVKLAKMCVYVLLLCLALFVTGTMAINSRAILGIYEQLLGIKSSEKASNQSTEKPLKISKQIDHMVYEGYFDQFQNHFNFTDTKTWQQRYYVSRKYILTETTYTPIILLLGGLDELVYSDFKSGVWDEMAKEAGAMLVCLEHRYHGQSEPTDDLSIENLLYLNSEQALADAAWFIFRAQRRRVKYVDVMSRTNWIAVGASHGGALAAKLKLKFPHLLNGALAVDAPILAVKKNSGSFKTILNVLDANPVAKKTVVEAYSIIHSVIYDQTTELRLKETFNLCDPKSTYYEIDDVQLLLWSISTLLGLALQSETLNPKTTKYKVLNILENDSGENEFKRFGKAIRKILKTNSISCLNVNYKDAVNSYKEKSWNSPIDDVLYYGLGSRQDLFQSCTQIGQFEIYDIYVPLDFYSNLCVAVFGKSYGVYNLENGVNRSNTYYGGLDIEVDNVYFISHSLDYLITLGVTSKIPENSMAVCINDPFYIVQEYCTAQRTSTRNDEWDIIVSTLKKWII